MIAVRSLVWVLGGLCGIAWWAISLLLGAKAYGVLGTYPVTGAIAGACAGVAMTALSIPVYRAPSPRALLWYSPLSVYAAIALYGALVFAIRSILNDFHPDQIRWAVGAQSVIGMWWGVTMLLPLFITVHLLAYANHRLLRIAHAGLVGTRQG
jgi:hypothetical protein